jgi:hypothetical protein
MTRSPAVVREHYRGVAGSLILGKAIASRYMSETDPEPRLRIMPGLRASGQSSPNRSRLDELMAEQPPREPSGLVPRSPGLPACQQSHLLGQFGQIDIPGELLGPRRRRSAQRSCKMTPEGKERALSEGFMSRISRIDRWRHRRPDRTSRRFSRRVGGREGQRRSK